MKRKPGSVGTKHRIDWHEYPVRLEDSTEILNLAENSIRPFTVGRKNWLFSDTPKGASASAAIYSLVETAKANGLNVHTYLNHLLLYMPDADYQNDPEALEQLMPWSEQIQVECK